MAAGPILSKSGFERVFKTQSTDLERLSLYQLKDSSTKGIEKAKHAILLEGQKERSYAGNIETFATEILDKPYLLKKGNTLELISEKTAFEILKIHTQGVQQTIPEMAFGKAKWEKYFGDIGAEPPLPPNIEDILNSDCIFWPGKKVRDTHLLVLIPETVNGRPFCLDSLSELIKAPKTGHQTQYGGYSEYIKKELGAKSYPSHWILMTRDVIKGSRNKTYDDQKAFVTRQAQKSKIPYEIPTALDVTTAILMHYVETGEALYTNDKLGTQWTYTRCQEMMHESQWPVTIGGFAAEGLSLTPYCFYFSFGLDDVGVGCCWNF